ncbi:hypothetical protein JYU19_01470 [bacterium AH-315-J21]|nr:hypothetical protein [bacterium AH-315-J21]
MRKASVSVYMAIVAVGSFCMLSCSANLVESKISMESDLSGVWVDTTVSIGERHIGPFDTPTGIIDTVYYVSTLALDDGAFVLRVPDFNTSAATPEGDRPFGFMSEMVLVGSYETKSDSLFLNYSSAIISDIDLDGNHDTVATIRTEPFRFEFFGDSLALYYNSFVGIDSSYVPRDTTGWTGELPAMIRPQSSLWPLSPFKHPGVFLRAE